MEKLSKKKFYNIYTDEISQYTNEIDFKRIAKVRLFYGLCIASCVLFFVLLYCLILPIHNFFKYSLFFVYVVSIFICVHYLVYSKIKFKNSLKEKVFTVLPEAFGEIHWNNDLLPKIVDITKSDLFAKHNIIKCDDTFVGKYKDVNFSVAETELRYAASEVTDKISFPVFKGLVIAFDCNKNFEGRTIIASKKYNKIKDKLFKNNFALLRYLFAVVLFTATFVLLSQTLLLKIICAVLGLFVGIILTLTWFKTGSKNSYADDVNLGKKFIISSTNEGELKSLVTAEFINMLNNLKVAYKSDEIKCAFQDNKILFAVSTNKNLFEIGDLFHSLRDPQNIKKFCDEIIAIYDLIEYFKLNEKSGL